MRVASADVELGGVPVRKGERLYVVNAAANRDLARYPRPDELDLERRGIYSHLAFNVGPRFCVGRWLARLEAAEAVLALLNRLPSLRLDPDGERPRFEQLMFRRLPAAPRALRRFRLITCRGRGEPSYDPAHEEAMIQDQ